MSVLTGIVIYTGHETKLMLNSTTAPLKRSNVERVTNHQIIILFVILIALAMISTIANQIWTNWHVHKDWYLFYDGKCLVCCKFGLGFSTQIRVMVFNATLSNISVILWQSVLLVEETGENHRAGTSH